MHRYFTIALAMITLTGCGEEPADAVLATAPEFFNLEEYFIQQEEQLAGHNLSKTVVINGSSETRALQEVDWEAELAPFRQSNIDRPALWDKYEVDSVRENNKLVIVYNARDKDLYTRRLEVTQLEGQVRLIKIDNANTNFIATTKQQLEWQPGKYRIESYQKARLSDPRLLEIIGEWQPGR